MATDKTTDVQQLRNLVQKFVDDRDWSKYHNPKDLAISIAIEASELLELFQWIKENQLAKITENPKKLVELKEELADIIIYCLSLANVLDVDVSRAVVEKISKNEEKYPTEKVKGDYKKYTEL
ncbi:nucleotide pyrophosphohydrolase [Chloroflexota bacterium]